MTQRIRDYFNEQIQVIQSFRAQEQGRDPDDQFYRQVLHMIQDDNGVERDTPFPTSTPGKKRKRSPNGPPKESPPPLTVVLEEQCLVS